MKVVKLNEIFRNEELKNEITNSIKRGDIFIYPTDTVYGLGCNASKLGSVKRIHSAKNRALNKPFSVIVPSKGWVWEHTFISKANKEFVNRLLPGPYTVILKAKTSVPKLVISENKTIGIRIPAGKFTDFIRKTNVLFITTSANLAGEQPITNVKAIPEQIKNVVDWTIDAGKLENPASRVFDLTTEEIKIVRY